MHTHRTPATAAAANPEGQFTLQEHDLEHFRVMLREQLAGDYENLRDVVNGANARTSEVYGLEATVARIASVERLAAAVGLF